MGARAERRLPETETFNIPNGFRNIFGGDYPIEYLVPFIIEHYLREQDQWVQKKLNPYFYRPTIFQHLITWIEENANLNTRIMTGALRGGKIRRTAQSIIVPTAIMFYRIAFPHLRITTCRTGQARIDTNLGILTELGRPEELETIVYQDNNVPFNNDLSADSRRGIAEALHTFRIYTAPSIHTPAPQGANNDAPEAISAAIRAFQLEAIRINPNITNFLGRLNRTTLIGMNRELPEGNWRRSPFWVVEERNVGSRYFLRPGVLPITAAYSQQGDGERDLVRGTWGNQRINDVVGSTMSASGCVVALVANIAYTFGSRRIDPNTILATHGNFQSNSISFSANGWINALASMGITGERVNRQLTADLFNRMATSNTTIFCVGIQVQWTGDPNLQDPTPEALAADDTLLEENPYPLDASHWVGASALETIGGREYFRISPTSVNDWNLGDNTSGNNRRGLGWLLRNNGQNIYVPLTRVAEYVVYSLPQRQ
jgi:hypothetical protein